MTRRTLLLSLLVAAAFSLVTAIVVTSLLDRLIWPSIVMGIPAGLISAAVVLLVGYIVLGRVSQDPSTRHNRPVNS